MPIVNVDRTVQGKSLILKLDNGVDERGKNIYTSKSFSNISEDAADANIMNTANVLASLQDKELQEISLQEKNILVEY